MNVKKSMLSAVMSLLMVSLISSISCVSKEYPVTETYHETVYKTEYKTESYTGTENVVVETIEGRNVMKPKVKWYTSLYFGEYGGIPSTYYYGYEVDTKHHSRKGVKVLLSSGIRSYKGVIRVYDLTGVGQVPCMPTTGFSGEVRRQIRWFSDLLAKLDIAPVLSVSHIGAEMEDHIIFHAEGVREFAILANTRHSRAISRVELVWADDIMAPKTVVKERQVAYEVPYEVEKQRAVMETRKVPIWEAIFNSQ